MLDDILKRPDREINPVSVHSPQFVRLFQIHLSKRSKIPVWLLGPIQPGGQFSRTTQTNNSTWCISILPLFKHFSDFECIPVSPWECQPLKFKRKKRNVGTDELRFLPVSRRSVRSNIGNSHAEVWTTWRQPPDTRPLWWRDHPNYFASQCCRTSIFLCQHPVNHTRVVGKSNSESQ